MIWFAGAATADRMADPSFHGEKECLQACISVEFLEDAAQMRLGCIRNNVQGLCDLHIGG